MSSLDDNQKKALSDWIVYALSKLKIAEKQIPLLNKYINSLIKVDSSYTKLKNSLHEFIDERADAFVDELQKRLDSKDFSFEKEPPPTKPKNTPPPPKKEEPKPQVQPPPKQTTSTESKKEVKPSSNTAKTNYESTKKQENTTKASSTENNSEFIFNPQQKQRQQSTASSTKSESTNEFIFNPSQQQKQQSSASSSKSQQQKRQDQVKSQQKSQHQGQHPQQKQQQPQHQKPQHPPNSQKSSISNALFDQEDLINDGEDEEPQSNEVTEKVSEEKIETKNTEPPAHYIIFIAGIDRNNSSILSLYKDFTTYGRILAIEFNEEDKVAYIEFDELLGAFKAVKAHNKKNLFKNAYVQIDYAIPPDPEKLADLESEYNKRKQLRQEKKQQTLQQQLEQQKKEENPEISQEADDLINTISGKINDLQKQISQCTDPEEARTLKDNLEKYQTLFSDIRKVESTD